MRSSRPAASLLSSVRTKPLCHYPTTCQVVLPQLRQQPFHSTNPRPKHYKPKHKSLSQAQLQKLVEKNTTAYKPYTDEERAHLAKRYNAEQMSAIEAAEAAFSPSDLATQLKLRRDPMRYTYLDDFSRIEPTIDKKISRIRGEGSDYEHKTDFAKMPDTVDIFGQIEDAVKADEDKGSWVLNPELDMSGKEAEEGEEQPAYAFDRDDELAVKRALLDDPEYFAALEDPEKKDKKAIYDKFYALRLKELEDQPLPKHNRFALDPLNDKLDALLELDSPDVAPEIPKIVDPTIRWAPTEDEIPDTGMEEEAVAAYMRVGKQMGLTFEQLRRYRVKTITAHTVVNQTRLGKIRSMYYLVVAGNGNGLVGLGEGKSLEGEDAKLIATLNALRSMVPIMRYENRTIYGEVMGKSGAVEVRLSARQPGFGIRCSEKIFEIARCAGLSDLQAKVTRPCKNPMNVAKAMLAALRSQRDPEDIARGRGRKLVDVRKVYYSGLV